MSKRKITITVLSILIAIAFIAIPNKVKAATAPSTPVYFGISLIRDNSATNVYNGKNAGKNIGYAIGDPTSNSTANELRTGANIWNIMTYPNTNTSSTGTEGNYYCVREAAGFTDSKDTFTKIKQYTNSFEIKQDNKSTITSNVGFLRDISDESYKGLIALSNFLYLGGTDAERIEFLKSIGINTDLDSDDADYDVLLTESDIKAVQQAAIWYYSNKHGQTISNQWDTLYNNVSKGSWLNYTVDGSEYSSLSGYDFKNSIYGQLGSGLDRQEQANILYRYLINQANTLSKKENMDINTKIIVYTNLADQDNTQPIIYVERLPQVVKEFDLALRKYITKVGNKTLTGVETRVPNIDESTIKTQNTATYKHRKDPVIVKNGDVVTYNLTIYNEGEKSKQNLPRL